MAVPRPVLLAILGLALCVTAMVAFRGVGGEEDPVAPATIPTTQSQSGSGSQAAKTGARGRARTRAGKQEDASTRAKDRAGAQTAEPKLTKAEVAARRKKATLAHVSAALGSGDVVVLFFSRPGAADDTGAEQSVEQLRGIHGVKVFSPDFDDLNDYRPVLAGVGVAQVPAIVIARPGHKAQLVEGFVDRKSLRQQVEDALR